MPKFNDIQNKTTILITCPKGLSGYLKNEVEANGYVTTGNFSTGVSIKGSMADCVKLNMVLFTAHHVLMLINEFSCRNPDELYKKVNAIDWENIVPPAGYLCVTSIVHTPTITDTRFANLKCKDAIVDRLAQRNGKRCDSGSERDNTVIHVYWNEDRCLVYIDTSGQPLTKRGYRLNPGYAPMQESLAAAVVHATGWNGIGNFVNPMCGSATIAIEAALMAHNKAPGILRTNFGFMHLVSFDNDAYTKLRRELIMNEKKILTGRIIATDHDEATLAAAKNNANIAGIADSIDFDVCDFDLTEIPEGNGIVAFNPEYGFRMGDPETLKNVYKRIGDFLKQRCGGYRGFVFTGNFDLAKRIGLKSKRKIPFLSGKIECRLYEYELYAGKRQ